MLNIPLKDYLRETRIFNTRLAWAGAGVVIVILVLLARMVYLQVIDYRHYATLSQENRIKPVPVPPARGLILDRHGVVLAQNFPVYTLEITPEQVDDMDALRTELGKLVRITDTDNQNFDKQLAERPPFENLTLRSYLTDQEAARIAVRLPFLNGVQLGARLQRHYPFGGLAGHALGYVSRISEQDLDRIDKADYRGMEYIGKLGLEYTYQDLLMGRVGVEKVETNAHGRTLRTLDRIPPMAGKRLYLNLDARAQAVAEQALGDHRGAVVAIQPSTGAVLVFASTPTYDANAFVNGIDPAAYRALLNDPDKPLIDRALNGQYAPGSTIKAFLGLADIEVGSAVGMPRQIVCDGSYHLPGSAHQFRDWKRGGHGPVMLRDAIIQSCDVFFYRLAVALGPERIHDFLAPFGFGSPTGIDLPGESSGLLPTPEWKQAHGQTWYPGDTVVIGIGQGLLLVTPLQLADAMATIANHGVRMKPELLHAYTNPRGRDRTVITPKVLDRVPVKNKDDWNQLISYLVGVVNSPHGTARRIGYNAPYKIAGKTGTAQVTEMAPGTHYNAKETPERLRDHALFIGFAPADAPKVAVAVVVENGGHGGSTAAPVARKVMDQIILGGPANRKHPRGGLHNVARITKEQPR